MTSSVEDVLIDSLQFKPSPGASYLTAKRNTRWHASGSDTYSSSTGVRVLRFALTGAAQEWCDPQSIRLQFDLNETGNEANKHLKPLTGPWGLIQRVSVRVLGTLVEDITNYNRCYQQFFMGLTKEARQREIDLGFGGTVDHEGNVTIEPILVNTKKTVTMNLLCGLFSGQAKYLWLSAMGPVTIEIELADSNAIMDTSDVTTAGSQTWTITNAMVLGSVVDISPDLLNAYTKHLEEAVACLITSVLSQMWSTQSLIRRISQ